MIENLLIVLSVCLVFWALEQKVKDYISTRMPKASDIPQQTIDDLFLGMIRTISGDADVIRFDYCANNDTWQIKIGELNAGGEMHMLWSSRDYETITQCWKEFVLFHSEP